MSEQLGYCSERIFHSMNFTQMHERLRLELLRRIQRGTLSVSLLARHTGLGQSHLSNFLLKNRKLSMAALDRVLLAEHLNTGDLLDLNSRRSHEAEIETNDAVPLVSQATALVEPHIRPSSVRRWVYVPADLLATLCPRTVNRRKSWDRFVAVSIPTIEALPMEPLILPDAVVVLDRHYTSLRPYRPSRINLYAVRDGNQLVFRYLDFVVNRLVLRPHNLAFPVDLVQIPSHETLADWIAGRIVLVIKEV